jgi:hypothetical protein
LGIGDWGLGPIPNPQSPIPNPQSPIIFIEYLEFQIQLKLILKIKIMNYFFFFKKSNKPNKRNIIKIN